MKKNLEKYFDSYIQKGHLKKENIGLDQIKSLIESAEKDLHDAKVLMEARKTLDISEERYYTAAYTSMLKLARAVLFLNDLRPSDGQQHRTTIEVAGLILGDEFSKLILDFDKMRKKRNEFTCEPKYPIGEAESKKAVDSAGEFFRKVKKYVNKIDPRLKLF